MPRAVVNACGKEVWIEGRVLRIAHVDGEKYTVPEDPEAFLRELRGCRERIDLFTFIQKPPETEPRYGYPMERDNLAVLPITTFDHWWKHQITNKVRNAARQAEKKGLEVREVPFDEVLLRGIVEIHNESPVRQGRRFPHYGMDLEGARRYAGTFPERSFFIAALDEGRPVGFMKLTVDESRNHACVVNILAMLSERNRAPTNAMIAQAVKSCAARGLSYLVYEHFTYGRRQTDGLSQFKESNGFRRMDVPRYFIPLTGWGKLALALGWHRRWTEFCPEFLADRYRDLRSRWYAHRYRLSSG